MPAMDPLIVLEDSDEDYDTLCVAAKGAGILNQIYRVLTGDECLRLLRTAAPIHPALILLDLNAPGTDGRETLVHIKADVSMRVIPVVIHTTSANPRDLHHCYALGANAYHVKPIRYTEHLMQLTTILEYWLRCVSSPYATA